MRPLLAAGVILALSHPVYAMGSDVTFDLVAWNADGSAALLRRTTMRDGDRATGYVVVSATAEPVDVAISQLSHDGPGKDTEQLPATECSASANALAKALAAQSFKDVAVHADRCKQGSRDVVSVTPAAARDAELSWIALPQGRTATKREAAAIAVLQLAAPKYKPFVHNEACDFTGDGFDVAVRDEQRLVVVVDTILCNSPTRMRVRPFVPSKKTFAERKSVE